MEEVKNKIRDFKLTVWALENKNTIYLLIFVMLVFGSISYVSLPKELFPEVNFPTVFVQTVYPGNSPEDIENLITRPLEKQLKTLDGLKEVRSTSAQDYSMVFVEFNSNINVDDVLQDVKDAVDKAKSDLPDNLLTDPSVSELDFSAFPVVNINLSGDFNLDELKYYAEYLQEGIESVSEVSKVDIKGLDDREVQINVDLHKMESYNLSLTNIENAIAYENTTMSGGDIKMGNTNRSIRIVGEFTDLEEIRNIVVKNENLNIVYLRDVAEVIDTYADPKSFARLDKNNVVSLQVVKKSGDNLLSCVEKTMLKVDEAKESKHIPENLIITYTNDQSKNVNSQLDNLENSMIMGVIFVVGILFFFLGLRNSLLVGMAIPMSMLLSFVVLGMMGATINMIVLFALVLALGMLVDNAIVTVENIYRYVDEGEPIKSAVRKATSEIAVPIISSTATTVVAFLPLAFWNDLMGEFIKYLPVTLMIVLISSLVVALVMIPVIGESMIVPTKDTKAPNRKKMLIIAAAFAVLSIPFYLAKSFTLANLLALSSLMIFIYILALYKASVYFQNVLLVKLENLYFRFIQFSLSKRNPQILLIGITLLLFASIIFTAVRALKVSLFPDNQPQYINVVAELPIGTDIEYTDSLTKIFEDDLISLMTPYKDIIESYLTTVGEGVSRDGEMAIGTNTHKARITIKFVDFQFRRGINTSDLMSEMTHFFHNKYAGVSVFVEKNRNGPPVGKPINIELKGDDLMTLISQSDSIIKRIEKAKIEGIENLKIDIETGKPEIIVTVDKQKAQRFGLSTSQIAMNIRTSLFGKEISDYKIGEDEFPIQLKLADEYRYTLSALMNQKITFRNNTGKLLSVPISAVAEIKLNNSFGQVKRVEQKRTVIVYSNVVEGFNSNEVNKYIKAELANYKMPDGYTYAFTGEQEDMQQTTNFLMKAMLIAVALIFIIMITQFNSIVKPLIVFFSVVLSTIGVFGGMSTFKMDFVLMMTGIGIISLAGVVVNNAIVLIDYIDVLKSKRKTELGLDKDDNLPIEEIIPCITQAGKTRLRPVLLTAITTVLGLVPMAIGFNINFETLFSEFKPDIYLGGDNASFWGPMAWTVIFGLTFATFLTLVVVPAQYLIANRIKLFFVNRKKK